MERDPQSPEQSPQQAGSLPPDDTQSSPAAQPAASPAGASQPAAYPLYPQGYPQTTPYPASAPMAMPGYPYPQSFAPPYPQPAQATAFQPDKKKRDIPLFVVGIITAVLFIVSLSGVAIIAFSLGRATANSAVVGASQSAATSTPTAATSGSTQHHHVGEQVSVASTYLVTVNSVTTSSGDQFLPPKAGDTFLIVDVTFKNISNQEQFVSSLTQFSLKDTTGQQYLPSFTGGGVPPDGKLEPGDLLRGQLSYEVPLSQNDFTLSFDATQFGSGLTIWDLSI